ncbi:MAG: nucleotide exchange factor GrpE [Muribaculaceae bacterium]|nr:nucleotide exchange factor GrpE [Muribaculaceae bacterium]
MSDKDKEKQAKAAKEAKPETIDETEVVEAEVVDVDPVDEADETEALKKQLAEAQAALDKEKREYVFLLAEFDNYRKRAGREKSEIIRNASEKAMKDLLPIVDDMERGIEANKSSDSAEAIKEGLQLIYNKLVKYLENNGVKPIESTGKNFDPDLHNAIAMVPTDDPDQKGKVIDTPTKGYTINDKVLRHASVAVGQ